MYTIRRLNAKASAVSLAVAVMTATALAAPQSAHAATAAMPSDFNGDGYADLAIGVPFEDIGDRNGAGAVNVLHGSATGLTASGDQLWSQDSTGVKGVSQGSPYAGDGDGFGKIVASGDFDADGFADLAIGVPRDRVGAEGIKGGAVNVLYGSGHGLTAAGDQRLSQAELPGAPGWNDRFGWALATGDLDGDGYWDLAIGAPGDDIGGLADAGSVTVLSGGPDGLRVTSATVLTLASVPSPNESQAAFGWSIAAGDLDGDGFAVLAVGTFAGGGDGEVAIFHGSEDGIDSGPTQLWSQDSPGVADGGEKGSFGASIAIADFDGDGFADLAVGVPDEGPPGWTGYDAGTGAVEILYGTQDGLTARGNQLWFPPHGWAPSDDDYGPRFGATLAAGDFDGNGAADLAVGGPDTGQQLGIVVVIHGGPNGLAFTGAKLWTQDTPGVPGTAERGDRFGAGLGSGDFGRSGKDDLAIGAPGEHFGQTRAGRITVMYGRSSGLSATNAQTWTQDTAGVKDHAESGDNFGDSLSGLTTGDGQ